MRLREHYPPPPYAAPDQYLDHGRVQFGHRSAAAPEARAPKGYQRSDALIGEKISEQLAQWDQIDFSDVSFRVQAGKVQLDGTVPDRWMKHAIEDIASDCFGVTDVDNRIKVRRT